jgi:thioredoxin 1
MVKKITNNDMTEAKAAKLAFVDFSATWCAPCSMLAPIVEELSDEMSEVAFYNADVDENNQLAAEFRVMSIPYLVVLKEGEVVAKAVGVQSKEELKKMITEQK